MSIYVYKIVSSLEPQFEYVKDRLTPKKLKCISLELTEGKILYSPELSDSVEKVIRSKSTRALLNKALENGPLIILKGSAEHVPQGGSWSVQERTIRISEVENSKRQLGHLVFELSNALQHAPQSTLSEDVMNRQVGKEEYVKRWKKIEFDAVQDFISAIQPCIKERLCFKESDLYIPEFFPKELTWEKHWEDIKNSDHANQFRSDWDQQIKPSYCSKNPKSKDCNMKNKKQSKGI